MNDLTELVNNNLGKVIIINPREYFTAFHSYLLIIVLCVLDKFSEYVTLLFCLLIV